MEYDIKITDNSPQAASIINMLKTFAFDYDFIEINEKGKSELTFEQEKELDRRYEFYLNNPTVGKSWEEVKANL